jgi:hypothetical protein
MSAFKNIPSLIGGTAVVAAATIGVDRRAGASLRGAAAVRGDYLRLPRPGQFRQLPGDDQGCVSDE